MSRKTKARRIRPSLRLAPPRYWHVYDAPKVTRPLALICGACGTEGRYKVGTVTLDANIVRSSDKDVMQRAVGFTGYFRCHKCDAGGPWTLPQETEMYVMAMAIGAAAGMEDLPLVVGCTATFDKRVFRYATECEAHLKGLIDGEPQRSFLWVRLGNLYSHAGLNDRAETAYRRAIELDPTDIEAHSMFGQLLVETDRSLEAVPHWHAVLKHARDARYVRVGLRRTLVRGAIQCLLEARAESKGQIDLLPPINPDEIEKPSGDEPLILKLREFDLSSEDGLDQLCDMFLERLNRPWEEPSRLRKKPRLDDWMTPIRREACAVGRNDLCPCGSGRKYKKCCSLAPASAGRVHGS
jgi:hypothetical protein